MSSTTELLNDFKKEQTKLNFITSRIKALVSLLEGTIKAETEIPSPSHVQTPLIVNYLITLVFVNYIIDLKTQNKELTKMAAWLEELAGLAGLGG